MNLKDERAIGTIGRMECLGDTTEIGRIRVLVLMLDGSRVAMTCE